MELLGVARGDAEEALSKADGQIRRALERG
jgi:hypothetical protein